MNATRVRIIQSWTGSSNHLAAALVPGFHWKAKRGVVHLVLVVAVLASLVPALTLSSASTAPRLEASLALVAAQSPEQMVSVIVQKSVQDGSAERLVAQLGGQA